MLRARCGALVAASLLFTCGCISLSDHPWFSKLGHGCGRECCGGEMVADGEGPIIESCGPTCPTPTAPGLGAMPPLSPQNTMPQLTPPPRLVPQPQAQPNPYVPQ